MNMNCLLSDAIARIKNAKRNDRISVNVKWSSKTMNVLNVLKDNGVVVKDVAVQNIDNVKKEILVFLRNERLYELNVVSKPGYVKHVTKDKIPRPKNGFGVIVISTSSGMMTGAEAFRRGIGGKIMAYAF
jgi:small subunit ribosomal protein S8